MVQNTTYIDYELTRGAMATAVIFGDADKRTEPRETAMAGTEISLLEADEEDKKVFCEMSEGTPVRFICDLENRPQQIFYAVPFVDAFAMDDFGGYYVSLGESVHNPRKDVQIFKNRNEAMDKFEIIAE